MIRKWPFLLCLVFILQHNAAWSADSLNVEKNMTLLPRILAFYDTITAHFASNPSLQCDTTISSSVKTKLEDVMHINDRGGWQCTEGIIVSMLHKQSSFSPKDRIYIYNAFAEFLDNHQMYDSAQVIAHLTRTMAQKEKMKTEEGRALLIISHAAMMQGKLSFASQWADSALAIARASKDKKLEGRVLFQIGSCTRRYFTAPTHRTIPYYEQALALAEATNDSIGIFNSNLYIYDDYAQSNTSWKAISNLEAAINIGLATGNVLQRYRISLIVGLQLWENNELEKGRKLVYEARRLAQAQRLPYQEEHCDIQLSGYYFHMLSLPQYDSALHYIDLAEAVPGVDSLFSNFYLLRADIYYAAHDYQNASINYIKGLSKNRDDFLVNNQQQLNSWEAQLHTKEKELEIVQKENARKTLVYALLALLAVLIVLVWALNEQRKSRRKLASQNAVVVRQSGELKESLAEKEILLKEIHHRVKNNLAVISGLLELQNDRIDDDKIKAAFNEAQMRVRSVALIHQNLYQHEDLANIELSVFLRDLSKQVKDVFEIDKKVELNLDMPLTFIDIDTAVPLGLIVNELITNSYKYAFAQTASPQIGIKIASVQPGHFVLVYRDNGVGLPQGIDMDYPASLGLRLITQLAIQLNGSVSYRFDGGAEFTILFTDAATRRKTE
jgi:two-component sensor histidine kinase